MTSSQANDPAAAEGPVVFDRAGKSIHEQFDDLYARVEALESKENSDSTRVTALEDEEKSEPTKDGVDAKTFYDAPENVDIPPADAGPHNSPS